MRATVDRPRLSGKQENKKTAEAKRLAAMSPEERERIRRADAKKQALQQILIKNGIRIGENFLAPEYNASEFCSKLLQKPVVAYVIPKAPATQEALDITVKAAVSDRTINSYQSRLGDLLQWFERKINFQKQSTDVFKKRQTALHKALQQAKVATKSSKEEEDEKFDNLQDTTQFALEQTISPTLMVITQNAYRCLDFEQVFKSAAQMYSFFTRHYPIGAVVHMINQHVYDNCKFMAGTASRLLKLIQIGAINLSSLKHIILDCSYEDDKQQTPFEFEECRSNVRVIAQFLSPDTKFWVL